MALLSGLLPFAAFAQTAAPADRSAALTPEARFLYAADANDFAAMQKLMVKDRASLSANDLIRKISSCYLRRVYKNDVSGEIWATWMCAEGDNKSRVVIGNVRHIEDQVAVDLLREDRNARPAPPRAGSAFAKDSN